MTRCSVRVYVEFQEQVNERARLGFVPAYRDRGSRLHIVLAHDRLTGRTLCGRLVTPFELGLTTDGARPCAQCFDRALSQQFRRRRKVEEHAGGR